MFEWSLAQCPRHKVEDECRPTKIAVKVVGRTLGNSIHDLVRELFPICRSITGDGVRETLRIVQRELPQLRLEEVPSGSQCFDWIVPPEWNIRDAYVIDPEGNKIIDFKKSNLHVVSYSMPVDAVVPLSVLQEHLHSLPELPHAIPYLTSYYEERWGFCVPHIQRQALKEGDYRVLIDSTLEPGNLTYGELIIPGDGEEEVFISTYVCHPSLANNELSGPTVSTFLAKQIQEWSSRRYTYRFVFLPETIGSIVYLARNLDHLRERVVAGFNVTCVGDDGTYSYLPSRDGNTLADEVALHVLKHTAPDFRRYSFLDRGSDERQYCSPGVDLPVVSVMRTKYGEYAQYHTSDDDLNFVTPSGLEGGYMALLRCVECLERNVRLQNAILCEPQLGRRRLYPTLGGSRESASDGIAMLLDVLAYCDGTRSLLSLAEEIGRPMWELIETVDALEQHELLRVMRTDGDRRLDKS